MSKWLDLNRASPVHAHRETQYRYQLHLAEFLKEIKPLIMIETGVHAGTSTIHILDAMDDTGKGFLHSIDPGPYHVEPHPRWHLWRGTSHELLDTVYKAACHLDGLDVFLHDSDHGFDCQAFEYAWAWDHVKPGGWILSDDYAWKGHGAWMKFCASHDLEWDTMGTCARARKPL